MQENTVPLADDEVTVTGPRFGDEESLRARPVVPLQDPAATDTHLNFGPQVALGARRWDFWKRPVVFNAILAVAALALTSTVLYQLSRRTSAPDNPQPAIRAVSEPIGVPLPQPRSEPDTTRVATDRARDGVRPDSPRRSREGTGRVDAIYEVRTDDDEDDDDENEGRRRRWEGRAGDDDGRNLRRARKAQRVRRELRRFKNILEDLR